MTTPNWTMVDIFADEGLSGTSTKKRKEFNRMIRLCKQRKIDLILTKSISRFARNTVDCLQSVRLLRENGIGVIFEKENIWDNSKKERRRLDWLEQLPFTLLFLDGNHENYDLLSKYPVEGWNGGKGEDHEHP